MISSSKKQLASIYWDDLISHPAPEAFVDILTAAYPQLEADDLIGEFGQRMWPSRAPCVLFKKIGIEAVKDLYENIKAMEPGYLVPDENDSGPGYYYFESVGSSLHMISKLLEDGLRKGKVSEQDFRYLYDLTGSFTLYSEKEHAKSNPFLKESVLHNVLRSGHYDLFDKMFDDYVTSRRAELPLPSMVSTSLFSGALLINPLLNGHTELFNKILSAVSAKGKVNSQSVYALTFDFWTRSSEFIPTLAKSSNTEIWRSALDAMQNQFSVKNLAPIKRAAKDGSLLHAIKGYVTILHVAKKSGFELSDNDLKSFIDWSDRISKSLGVTWTHSIPGDVKSMLSDIFKQADRKELLGRKSSQALIESLHMLMPKEKWMDHSRERYRADVLINQMNM